MIVLRRLERTDEADRLLVDALTRDPLDATLRRLGGAPLAGDAGLLLDVALDLRDAGETAEALALLADTAALQISGSGNLRPIAHYLAAALLEDLGRLEEARSERIEARTADLTWAFPNGLDALDALERAIVADPDDAVAHALLGMLLYANGRRRDATKAWEAAIGLGLHDPVLLRNAGLAAYNIDHDDDRAWARYEQAIRSAPADVRLRYEQDQLAIRLGHSTSARLAALSPVEHQVLTRDDFTIEYAHLLVEQGRADRALSLLESRSFHPWEGGEGKAIAAWDAARDAVGLPRMDPPASIGEARSPYSAPAAVNDDGVTDYFATSLPELLLFSREGAED